MSLRSRRHVLRSSLALVGVGLLAGCGGISVAPLAQPRRRPRIGYLAAGTEASARATLDAFRQGVHELGYVEGETISIEVRAAGGVTEALDGLAAEFARSQVDIILTSGNDAIRAARQATTTIPIVFARASNPVELGVAASLARPGGNATGITLQAGDESAKHLELLKEVVPGLSRVAVLWNRATEAWFKDTERAAQTLGLEVVSLYLQQPEDLSTLLANAIAEGADGLNVLPGVQFTPFSSEIVGFAATNRLPAIYGNLWAPLGALMTYSANVIENYHRASVFVDKILKGARPGELPIERPTKFQLIVNTSTVEELGLTIPPDVAAQVTEWVQ